MIYAPVLFNTNARYGSSMAKLANFLLKIAEMLKSRSSKWANIFLQKAQNVANKEGAKMKITLPKGEGPIQYEFERTDGDETTAWDHYYANAGLFIQDKVEEIKIDPDDIREGGLTLTDKARIEPVFQANLASSLWGFVNQKDRQEQLSYVIIVGLGIIIMMMMM